MLDLLRAMRGRPLLVIGDCVLDRWVSGDSSRMCREAPVPVIDVTGDVRVPGGAGNAAVAAAALSDEVRVVCAVGDDPWGDDLLSGLSARNVDVSPVVSVPGGSTVVKTRVQTQNQVVARFDEGFQALDEASAARLENAVKGEVRRISDMGGTVLVADYGGSAFLRDLLKDLLRPAAPGAALAPVVVDSHRPLQWASIGATAMTPNWGEASLMWSETHHLAEIPSRSDRGSWVLEHAAELLRICGSNMLALTLDRDGAVLVDSNGPSHRAYVRATDDAATTGAGDSFAAAFSLALAAQAEPAIALEVAMAAAEAAVRNVGTTPSNAFDILSKVVPAHRQALDEPQLTDLARRLAVDGCKVVFTAGCFDLLHRGHVASLDAARRMGDVLVVGIDNDDRTRRLKGPGRPVQPAQERAAVVSALSCVDHVVQLGDDGPSRALQLLQPALFVKGGDHDPALLPEADVAQKLGIEIRIVDYVPDHSVSSIIGEIRRAR